MSVFGVILVRIFPHSDWIRENADQNNSKYGHFSRSVYWLSSSSLKMMTTMNCFCRIIERRVALTLFPAVTIVRFSRSQNSDTTAAGSESAQNLNSGFVVRRCALVTTLHQNAKDVKGQDSNHDLRDFHQISLLILSEFKQINFYFSWNHQKAYGFFSWVPGK